MERSGWRIVAAFALLAVVAAVGICSMTHRQRSDDLWPEEDGGVNDNTDPNAPKSIASREITALYTNFYCDDPLDPSRSGVYRFDIEEKDVGELMLNVSGAIKGSTTVDPSVLEQVQEIIDEHELVKLNGIDSVTHALPVQYGPCSLSVDYATGERLYFRMDGDPDAQWCNDLKELLLQAFAGDRTMEPLFETQKE